MDHVVASPFAEPHVEPNPKALVRTGRVLTGLITASAHFRSFLLSTVR